MYFTLLAHYHSKHILCVLSLRECMQQPEGLGVDLLFIISMEQIHFLNQSKLVRTSLDLFFSKVQCTVRNFFGSRSNAVENGSD